MDGFYRGIESSLLAMSFALVVAVAAVAGPLSGALGPRGIATTLPTIIITDDAPGR